MAISTQPLLFIQWFFFLCLFVAPLPSRSLQATKNHKTAQKAHDRFQRWTSNHRDKGGNPQVLWVDGNNVRGIGKFEWNAVELQHRVVRFCHKYRIPNVILVWDHGSHKYACSRQYTFRHKSDVQTSVCNEIVISNDSSDNDFYVNLVILFSGLRHRADDVMVRESNHLISSSFEDDNNSNTKRHWSSLAFVTNDRDLNYKLRQQSIPGSVSIRLSRRKRRDSGKNYKHDIDQRNVLGNPLFCDSTGFVGLLSELDGEDGMEMNRFDLEASELIEKAKASIRQCSKSQRRGYNPRREKTWERCVQAEILRRLLGKKSHEEEKQRSDDETLLLKLEDRSAIFIAKYLEELHTTREYYADYGYGDPLVEEFSPFLGPSRLDKHQRRLLDRFNAMVRNEEHVLH